MSDNPYQVPNDFQGGGPNFGIGGGGPNGGTQAAMAKVAGPAIALIVVGVLNILFSLYGVVTSVLFVAGIWQVDNSPFDDLMQQGGDQAEFAKIFMQFTEAMQGPVGLVLNILTSVIAVVIILGALKMKKLQSHGFAMTAAILAMIPCLSNCCFLGVPIGIWALVVLLNSDVKRSFR